MIIRSVVSGYLKTILIIPDLDCATIVVIHRRETTLLEITTFNDNTKTCIHKITVEGSGGDLHIIAERD